MMGSERSERENRRAPSSRFGRRHFRSFCRSAEYMLHSLSSSTTPAALAALLVQDSLPSLTRDDPFLLSVLSRFQPQAQQHHLDHHQASIPVPGTRLKLR